MEPRIHITTLCSVPAIVPERAGPSSQSSSSSLQALPDSLPPHPLSRALSLDVFKGSIKVVPKVGGFGRKTTGLGAAPHLRHTPLASASAGIRILGIYCADDYFRYHGVGTHASTRDAGDNDVSHASNAIKIEGMCVDSQSNATPIASSCGASSSSSLSSDSGASYTTRKRVREDVLSVPADATEATDTECKKEEHPMCGVRAQLPPTPQQQGTRVGWRTDAVGARRLYVRFLVDKTLEATLPMDVMRERYPEVLIDYLLSTAAFV
jgi:hypothetical protein